MGCEERGEERRRNEREADATSATTRNTHLVAEVGHGLGLEDVLALALFDLPGHLLDGLPVGRGGGVSDERRRNAAATTKTKTRTCT